MSRVPQQFLVYEWRCPFCPQTRTSLTAAERATIEGQAENALRNHVKNTSSGGHADHGELPPEFDRVTDDAIEYVEVAADPSGEPTEPL